MSKRLVRIYKNPEGQGDYVNKTKAFLKKAQEGAEVQSAPDINTYLQHIYEQLSNDVTPEDVFTELITAGINENTAYQLLNSVVEQMVEAGEINPDNPITKKEKQEALQAQEQQAQNQEQESPEEIDAATEYFTSYADEKEYAQPDLEFQSGGQTIEDTELEDDSEEDESIFDQYSFLKQSAKYPGLTDYYQGFEPLSWEAIDTNVYQKGGGKKSFVKNVLKKLQEGGQEQDDKFIGQGDKFDTLTEDVSKIKQNFIDVVKNKANKAKLDETYDKMMKSGKPELINAAQTLSQNRTQASSQEGSFFQSGGYVGDDQPEMFMYGGTELPFYEADFLPEAQDGTEVKKTNNTSNLVLPTNQGRGLFGIGKRRTYSNMPYNAVTKEVYKDSLEGLTPYARTVHKRGILGRPKQWTDYYSKTEPLTPGQEIKAAYEKQLANAKNKDIAEKHGMTKEEWKSMPSEAKKAIRRGERKLNRELKRGEEMYADDKTFMSTPNLIPLQEFTNYTEQINDVNGNRLKIPKLFEITKRLEPELSFEERMNMNDPEFYRSEAKEGPLVDNWSKEDYKILDERRAEADAIYQQALKNRTENEQELIGKQLEDYIQEYGSLMRYQIKGAVKSPTNNLSVASDPTANTGNLMGMLKPQENSNTFMGSSSSFMNQNVPVNKEAGKEKSIVMDPEQIKGNKITSENFNNDTIAQDFRTARDFDGEAFNRGINATGNWFANMMNKRDAARQEREMYENNFTADNIYASSANKDKGDYVAYGQQTGMFRPDETGNDTLGRFAYGQMGGYMENFDYDIDDEVDMTEEELAEFIANGGEVEYLES